MNQFRNHTVASFHPPGSKPRAYTTHQWEVFKPEITRLYATQNLTDVIEIMKQQFSFWATERQYKHRISCWRLDKKVKTSEMDAIIRKQRQRKVQGKETRFRVRKIPVDPKKISRFLKGHFVDNGSHENSATPSVISYSTIEPENPNPLKPHQRNLDSRNGDAKPTFHSKPPVSNLTTQMSVTANTDLQQARREKKESMNEPKRPENLPPPGSKASNCGLSVMKEFFDFSAAAKTDERSTSSIIRDNHLPRIGSLSQQVPLATNNDDTVSETGSEHQIPETLDSLLELAKRVEDQGKYEGSRVLLQRVVRLHQQHANGHPSAQDALGALVRILRRQGRSFEAEKLLSGALKDFRNTQGETHTTTLHCMGDLALVIMDQGRYPEAVMLARSALQTRLKSSNQDDFDVLRSKAKLGIVLVASGQCEAAEAIHHEILSARRRTLGEEDPKTLSSMHDLAVSLQAQAKYQAMESTYRDMIEIQARTLGPHHEQTLNSMHGVATALTGQKRYAEAEGEYRKVISMRQVIYGEEHPHTLANMRNLAGILGDLRRHDEALSLFHEVLAVQRRTLGDEHPSTLKTEAYLAAFLISQGEDEKAEALSLKTLEAREKVLGAEHPSTLKSKINFAKILEDRGKYQEALRLYGQVLDVRRRILGDENFLTMNIIQRIRLVEELVKDEAETVMSDIEDIESGEFCDS